MNGALALPAFLAFFAGLWAGISFLFSRMSGWASLAARYPAASRPDGETLRWVSARLGGVSFKSCLNMTLSPDGFYMVPSLPFRLFMPPVLVPWRELGFAGFQKIFFWRFPLFRLGAEGPFLMLFRGSGERFRPYLAADGARAYESELRYEGGLFDKRLLLVAALGALVGLAAALLAAKR